MSTQKRKIDRPWLTATGVEIASDEVRQLSKSWNPETWENYLKWHDTSCREQIVSRLAFEKISDEQIESIFERFAQNPTDDTCAMCEKLLTKLPPLEREVLRLQYFEGWTEVEIGFELNRSRTGINQIKRRAISRLQREYSGDFVSARQLMRGEIISDDIISETIWNESGSGPIREPKLYSPKNEIAEIHAIKFSSLRDAMLELPEIARRILFFRYWCNFSIHQTARALGCGVNTVDEIAEASISKVKRSVLIFEYGTQFGGLK